MAQKNQNIWDNRQVKDINNCRLYLQVETILDIANNRGDQILKPILKGQRGGSQPTNLWPVQARPENGKKSAWEAWNKFMATLCTHGNSLQ